MIRYTALLLPAGFAARALNDQGIVVGGEDRAQVYHQGKLKTLPGKTDKDVGHSKDSAESISSTGVVAGRIGWFFGEPFQIPGEATLWRKGRAITAPKLRGFSNARFVGVNARGEAVGSAGTATMFEDTDAAEGATGLMTQSTRAIYWDGTTLHNEGGGTLLAINDAGAQVGSLAGQAVYRPSARAPWQTLARGEATAISSQGWVCGSRVVGNSSRILSEVTTGGKTETTYFPLWRAFVWHKGRLTDLPPLPNDEDSLATGVDDKGTVVGYSSRGRQTATLWRSESPTPLALEHLVSLKGWRLTQALGINKRGQILCLAMRAYQEERSVLLTPR